MKLHNLAVIFIIIIMPIIIVFSEYMNTQISIVKTEEQYDLNLLNATYDAVKAFQINTVNTMLYTPENRQSNAKAAVNVFYDSLKTSFNMESNASETMKEYVPAVITTLYDGYYIYAPFTNTLTNMNENEVDEEYQKEVIDGLKPFITYSCEYNLNNKNYVIYYTLDNYIEVEVFENNEFKEHKKGYLIGGIEKRNNGNTYRYDNVDFNKGDNEVLNEYIRLDDQLRLYYYAIIDGTKYYYEGTKPKSTVPAENDRIFYIDDNLRKHYVFTSYKNNEASFKEYYNRIFNRSSAYEYYKQAYEFTNWANENLGGLNPNRISDLDKNKYSEYEFQEVDNIFDGGKYQYSNSKFNRHRTDVIRAAITTNLSAAITGFNKYTKSGSEFIMPKISETNWELLENNVCIASFLQGLKIGGKTYNNYAVVPNNYNKEYISEKDIYLIKKDNTYTKANDKTVTKDNIKGKDELDKYEPAKASINFETRRTENDQYFNPMSYANGSKPYLKSYNAIEGGTKLGDITTIDMYRYMENEKSDDLPVRKAYYTALARERENAYKFSNNGVEIIEQRPGNNLIELESGVTTEGIETKTVRKDGEYKEVAVYPFISSSEETLDYIFSPLPQKEGYISAYLEMTDRDIIIKTTDEMPENYWKKDKFKDKEIIDPKETSVPDDWYDDIYLKQHFEPIEYEIVYDGNYATSGSMSNSKHIYDQEKALTKNTYTRTGYTFQGWGEKSVDSKKYNDQQIVKNLTKTHKAKVILYAVWNANTYTATFNGNGGPNGTSITKKYDEPLGPLPTPTRTGYTFDGWYTAANGGTKISPATTMTINPTYYAHWTANTYTATFNGNGGSNGTFITKKYDEPLGTLPTSTRTGYTFQGWYTAASGGTQITASTKMTVNPTYYAHWTINKYRQIVQVRYQNADGSYGGYSNVINKDYEHFSTVTWSRAQDATYNAASVSYQVTGAKTTQISVTRRTYTVLTRYRLQNADGSYGGYTNIVNGTYRYGQTIGAWSRVANASHNAASYGAFTVTGNVTKNIDVTRRGYTVLTRYRLQNADGSYGGYTNIVNGTYRYGQTIGAWSRGANASHNAASYGAFTVTGAVTKNIDVTRRTYTVTWNANGGTGGYTGTYRYGQTAWAPGTRRDFYTCTGWTANGFAVTGNTSSVAMWRENVLYLYYYRGGGTIQNRGNNVGVNADPCDINPWPISKVSNLRSFLNNDSATLPMKRKGYTATNYWTIGGTKVNQKSVITTYYIATLDGQYEGLRNGDIAVGATPVWKKN